MKVSKIGRRGFLGATALAVLGLVRTKKAQALGGGLLDQGGGFEYEVQRTDEEWRAMLSDDEYVILRKGSTEFPKSSTLWNEARDGIYSCRGCELNLYNSNWKVPLDKGWAFFKHAAPNSLLMAVDGAAADGMMGSDREGTRAMIEVHCRRCGSHIGHILKVEGKVLHCINGTALTFEQTSA